MSQGTEIFVVKVIKYGWNKTAGHFMLQHRSKHGRCDSFTALLIISSEILKNSKKNLNAKCIYVR
jgi:hypothetical protein